MVLVHHTIIQFFGQGIHYTQWQDTTITDSFTNEIIDKYSYILPCTNSRVEKDIALLKRDKNYFVYTTSSFFLDENDDVKVFCKHDFRIFKIGENSSGVSVQGISLRLGSFGTLLYNMSYFVSDEHNEYMSKADSMIIRHLTPRGEILYVFKFHE